MKEKKSTVILSKEEFHILRERSIELGRIAGLTEDFRNCDAEGHPTESVILGVMRLLANYREDQYIDLERNIAREKQRQEEEQT